MSMASAFHGAVVGENQRRDEEVLRRRQVIVGAGEEAAAGAARIVHAVLRADDRLNAADRNAVLAAGRHRHDMLRKAGPTPVAVPAEFGPHRRAEWAAYHPMRDELRR